MISRFKSRKGYRYVRLPHTPTRNRGGERHRLPLLLVRSTGRPGLLFNQDELGQYTIVTRASIFVLRRTRPRRARREPLRRGVLNARQRPHATLGRVRLQPGFPRGYSVYQFMVSQQALRARAAESGLKYGYPFRG
jgi:hypothetical protein